MSLIRQFSIPFAMALAALFVITAAMPAGAQITLPDGVVFTDPASTLRAGGAGYTITVQLKIHNADYPLNGIGVYFESNNLQILDISRGTFAVTDSSGRASLNVTTGPETGNVSVSVVLLSTDGDVRASKTYTVLGLGNISGTIADKSGKGIPGAVVTLYTLNNSSKGSIVQMAGNPATTSGADSALPGAYILNDVPYGTYYLEAVKDDQVANLTLSVSHPSESADITLSGYSPPTPTPTPSPTPEPTSSVTPVPASPTPGAKKSTGDSITQLAWIAGVAIVLAAVIIAIQLMRQKKGKK
ncbi:MAG: carboxypeptidase-like regulatory domain-containing protein [Methanocella sp.]